MKRTRLLHSGLSQVISELGHTDGLVICDAGLPIPPEVRRIDLAVERGLPPFLAVLDVVLSEMMVEGIVVASEIHAVNEDVYQGMLEAFGRHGMHPGVVEVPHVEFKSQTRLARAVVRTGECTPYANVILRSGVVF
ncbi:MAG: D-ribose pyranase [Armatimonadetes bacterium]|nr:D-ribose pyranase [Armatimonadota bacterium]